MESENFRTFTSALCNRIRKFGLYLLFHWSRWAFDQTKELWHCRLTSLIKEEVVVHNEQFFFLTLIYRWQKSQRDWFEDGNDHAVKLVRLIKNKFPSLQFRLGFLSMQVIQGSALKPRFRSGFVCVLFCKTFYVFWRLTFSVEFWYVFKVFVQLWT